MGAEVSKDTVRCWETYAAAHFIPFFETGEALCSEARLADYMRYRLTRVKRTTLKKELSALNRLFDWMLEQKLLGTKPAIPRIPRRATGTAHPKGKRETVTLTPEEMDAIVAQLPERCAIFPKFDGRHTLRKAALAAGLEPERASKVSAYDLRHSLATELTERSGNLVGVGYLLGHKHITTTNHYVHARRKAAESVLSGHRLGHQGVGRLGPPSSGVAQVLETKGCGREDSNLHGYYPTRSLADVAEEKAHEFKGASRSGTPENALGRSHFSPVVKNRARDLLCAVVDGGDVSVARIRDFARAVIDTPAFHTAQEILRGGSPEFAVRKALELASMVLGADDHAAGGVGAGSGTITSGARGENNTNSRSGSCQ